MNDKNSKIAAALAFLLLAGASSAHHSPVAFDTGVTDFAISGEVEYVDMRNPHSVMRLRVAAEDGSATGVADACSTYRAVMREATNCAVRFFRRYRIPPTG